VGFLAGKTTYLGVTDAAATGATGGYFRNVAVATAKTIDLQLSVAGVDTEADNNTTVLVRLDLKDSVV
jgi:hypothetical protein